ncbi:DUF4145 domain-containing protein [Vibrio parahaemolyticus]|uniref:DUF4145 domain-containing protein n=1 Tax=Vibrio parahaemolyticus TaxID=670 RepID=UPI002B208DA4|nr:DUF4145 domain-containing protein [Vibrio parahaemolyticus]MEA5316846.1 DUF4145 domain-containing protein [Vibrio parahaemolyticus]
MENQSPKLDKSSFKCPICNAFSAMSWDWIRTPSESLSMKRAQCHCCEDYSVWRMVNGNWRMIHPLVIDAPLPNPDLPETCVTDYMEAREIASMSPRGAAALLRLCIQKLCKELGADGGNINKDIATLVSLGLPKRVQQALDVVRVVGNNAVHPGELSFEDKPDIVMALFSLVNIIVDNQITQPKQVGELFESLPQGARDAVERRDA